MRRRRRATSYARPSLAAINSAGRGAYALAVGVMVLLLVGAGYWYLERTLYVDPSFVVFEVMYTGKPVISEHRYGAFVTQAWPLLAHAAGLPLAAVLWFYSVSFYVFYLAVLLLLGLRYRQYGLGVLFACYFTLTVSDTYFWPNNEIHQAVGWGMWYLGLYRYADLVRGFTPLKHGALALLGILALNTHPLAAAPLGFLWVYLWVADGRRWSADFAIQCMILLAGLALRYYLSHDSWYDGYKLRGISTLSWTSFWAGFSSGHARTLAAGWWPGYVALPLVLLLGLSALLRRRKWLLALLTVGACLLYAGLVFVTYPASFDRELLFYLESEWLGLSLIAGAPFCLQWVTGAQRTPAVMLVVGLLFTGSVLRIAGSSAYFGRRLANLITLTDELAAAGQPKVSWAQGEELAAYFGLRWGLPTETLLLSGLRRPDRPVTVKATDGVGSGASVPVGTFRGDFRDVPISGIDRRYFALDPILPYSEADSLLRNRILSQLRPLPE